MRNCVQCNNSDKILVIRHLLLVYRKRPSHPWDEVAIDIVGSLKGEHSTPYLIVLLDLY